MTLLSSTKCFEVRAGTGATNPEAHEISAERANKDDVILIESVKWDDYPGTICFLACHFSGSPERPSQAAVFVDHTPRWVIPSGSFYMENTLI